MDDIRTKRLYWREPRLSDVDGYMAFVSDYKVVKWTTTWPYPADRAFTASRCVPVDPARGFAGPVFLGDEQIGGIGVLDADLGYFFAPGHWGHGYASEMTRAMLTRAFARYDWDEISAGVFDGNPASVRVLEKLGFRKSGQSRVFSKAQGRELSGPDFSLSRADWIAANPLHIETDRLLIRGLIDDDWRDLQRIGSHHAVARMMYSLKSPWADADVKTWLAHSKWQGRLGFRPAVTLKGGTFIGALGIGGDPCTVAYFIDPEHAGKGYATEAMSAFVQDCFMRFGLTEILAARFADNPASGRILQKLGFVKTGEGLGESAARLEDEPEYRYRLNRTQFKAAT